MTEKPLLNAASLLDLKAELLRKQESLKEAKLKRGVYSDFSGSKLKRPQNEPKVKKQAKVDKVPELNQQEELALQKSRAMLEKKAMLYDKLSRGVIVPDEEQSENFLVNFEKKVPEQVLSTDRENIRLESGLLTDVTKIPLPEKSDVKYSNFVPAQSVPANPADTLSEDGNEFGPVHYQNVQHKEVRDHGVGYFSFSMDDEERKKQLEALNALRHHTEDQQKALLKKKRKKQALLKSRLAKVRLRKNIPSTGSDDEEDEIDEEESDKDEEEIQQSIEEEIITSQPEHVEESKPVRMRPWDKGKDFSDLLPERKTKHTGFVNQWVENKRAERNAEFAPPQSYAHPTNRTYQRPKIQTSFKTEVPQSDKGEVKENEDAAKIISEKISLIRQQF